jgi:hypothetical protein
MKVCCHCKIEQLESEYAKDRTRGDGLFPQCAACKREGKRLYYLANKESINTKSASWHKAHPEQSRAIKKRYRETHKELTYQRVKERKLKDPQSFRDHRSRYYQRHRESILTKSRERVAANPEKNRQRHTEYARANRAAINAKSRQRYANDPTTHAQRVKSWHDRHPEKRITYVHRRRARKLQTAALTHQKNGTRLKRFTTTPALHVCVQSRS